MEDDTYIHVEFQTTDKGKYNKLDRITKSIKIVKKIDNEYKYDI